MYGDPGSDEWLMQAVAQGRREPLSTLLRRHASPLLTFIQRMIGDRHRAEELFQEVFLAVWTHRGNYQYPRRFRPWLFGIAINKCRADFRKPVLKPAALDDESAELVVAAGPSPAEAAVAAETAKLVAAAVARLPETQRMVLILRIWNGLPYTEIAQTMKLARTTVRSHMFHALAAVRKYLEPRMKDLY
jgi:RNA polymerase sigma-70 factor (ECF subfamily)